MVDEFNTSSAHVLPAITIVKLCLIGIYALIVFMVLFLYIRSKSNKRLGVNILIIVQFIAELLSAVQSFAINMPTTMYSFIIGIPVIVLEIFLCNIALKYKKNRLVYCILIISSIIVLPLQYHPMEIIPLKYQLIFHHRLHK